MDRNNIHQLFFFEIPSLLKKKKNLTDEEVESLYSGVMDHFVTIYDRFPSKREQLENIKLLNDFKFVNLPQWLLNSFKEALYLFINNFYASSVANIGIICEFLVKYALESKNIMLDVNKSQYQRLKYIRNKKLLEPNVLENFLVINEIRNKFIHLDYVDSNRSKLKEESLLVINNLIEILNFFSLKYFVSQN